MNDRNLVDIVSLMVTTELSKFRKIIIASIREKTLNVNSMKIYGYKIVLA